MSLVSRRLRHIASILGVVTGLLLFCSPPVGAQSDETETAEVTQSVHGRLQGRDRDPVAGVTISATTEDGAEVGSTDTADDGSWQIPVDSGGTYVVTIDVDTLPEGITLRDADKASLTLPVRAGQDKVGMFALSSGDGEASGSTVSRLDRLSNLAAEGVKFGLMIALAALGLSLVFGVTGLVNFAHGELLAFGAIMTFWLERGFGPLPALPLLLAVLIAVFLTGLLGAIFEKAVFGPVRARGSGDIAAMVISIGLALVVRHLFLILFGSRAEFYLDFRLQSQFRIGPVALTPKSWLTIVIAGAVLLAFGWALQSTRIGTAMRAVSANKDLAESSGIDVERVVISTWIVGAALAGLAGALFGLSESIQWNMGYEVLLFIFAAVVLGGLGTAYGAMLGGLVVGLVTQLSTYWFPSELKLMFALIVLIVILIARPQGILGLKERFG